MSSAAIPAIKTLYDLIEKWINIGVDRITKPFHEIVEPMHDALTEIHGDYRRIFLETKRKFIGMDDLRDQDFLQRFIEAKESFQSARQEREHLRDKLRKQASTFLKLSQHAPTQRYIASLIHYFLEEKEEAPTDETLDALVKEVIRQGGESYYSTPSVRLELRLRETYSPVEAANLIESTLNSLNNRYVESCIRFICLKYEMTQIA
jgi:hypothetical protein